MAEQTESRIGVPNDSAGKFRVLEEYVAGCAFDIVVFTNLEVRDFLFVAIAAIEYRRMGSRPRQLTVDPADMTIATPMNQRVQTCRPQIPIHEERFMRTMAAGATDRLVVDSHEFIMFPPVHLWKRTWPRREQSVTDKASLAVEWNLRSDFGIVDVFPTGTMTRFAWHRKVRILYMQIHDVVMAVGTHLRADMFLWKITGLFDIRQPIETLFSKGRGNKRDSKDRCNHEDNPNDYKDLERMAIVGLFF